MPRPRPRKIIAPRFMAHPHKLSHTAERELRSCLGLDDDARNWGGAQQHTEVYLGAHEGAVGAFDKGPRAADYHLRLTQIRKAARNILVIMEQLQGDWIRDDLIQALPEKTMQALHAREQAIIELFDACAVVAKKLHEKKKDAPGQGRPRNDALRAVIDGLRQVFADFYQGDDSDRTKFGAISSLSAREADEREFVKIALDDAKIPHPKNLGQFFVTAGK